MPDRSPVVGVEIRVFRIAAKRRPGDLRHPLRLAVNPCGSYSQTAGPLVNGFACQRHARPEDKAYGSGEVVGLLVGMSEPVVHAVSAFRVVPANRVLLAQDQTSPALHASHVVVVDPALSIGREALRGTEIQARMGPAFSTLIPVNHDVRGVVHIVLKRLQTFGNGHGVPRPQAARESMDDR